MQICGYFRVQMKLEGISTRSARRHAAVAQSSQRRFGYMMEDTLAPRLPQLKQYALAASYSRTNQSQKILILFLIVPLVHVEYFVAEFICSFVAFYARVSIAMFQDVATLDE